MTRLSCLWCGNVYSTRGFSGHVLRASHRGHVFSSYDRLARMCRVYYTKQALELLKKYFVFTEHVFTTS